MLFYLCEHCGIIRSHSKTDSVRPLCCDTPMTILVSKSLNSDISKHITSILKKDNIIKLIIGS